MRDTIDKIKGGERFWLGHVESIQEIGEFAFVEYVDKKHDRYGFAVFIQGVSIGQSASTLDDAMLVALAYKYDGANSPIAELTRRMLGNELHRDYLPYLERIAK